MLRRPRVGGGVKRCPRCHKRFKWNPSWRFWSLSFGTLWIDGGGEGRSRNGVITCHRCPGSYLASGYDGYVTNLDIDERERAT